MARLPPPPHVLMANAGDDPDDDQDQDTSPGGDSDNDALPGSAAANGAPMSMAPGGAAIGGAAPGAMPPAGVAQQAEGMIEQMIQQNLTPEEVQEVNSMLTPRLTQLLTKADPALQILVQAFADAGGGDAADSGDAQDGSGGDNDADALSMTGSQRQYQPDYGAPGGPDAGGTGPDPGLMRRARSGLGMVGG